MASASGTHAHAPAGLRGVLAGSVLLGLVAALLVGVAGPKAGIIVFGGLIGLVASAVAPGVVLAAYLLIPFYKAAVQPLFPVDITPVLAVLNVIQVIPIALAGRRVSGVSAGGLLLWVGLGLLVLAGVLYAPDQGLAMSHAVSWWTLVLLPILFAAWRVSSDRRFVRQLLWTMYALAVYAVLVGMTLLPRTDRLALLGTNTTNAALLVLLVPLLGTVYVLPAGNRLLSLATAALIPASLVVALASGARGPLIVLLLLAVLGAAILLTRRRSVSRRSVVGAAALGLASVVGVLVAAPALPVGSTGRFSLFADFVESWLAGNTGTAADTSSGARVTLFGLAARLFQQHPFLGVGTAGFEALSPRYLSPLEADAYPHNVILQFAAEFGLVGLAVLVSLAALALLRPLPDRESSCVRIALLFFLLEGMVGGSIYTERMTWGLLMIVLLVDAAGVTALAVPGRRGEAAPPTPAGSGPGADRLPP